MNSMNNDTMHFNQKTTLGIFILNIRKSNSHFLNVMPYWDSILSDHIVSK